MLPSFPDPTHGLGRALRPFTTIRDILSKLRNIITPAHMHASTKKNEAPYNDNKPLGQCITTDGGKGDLHPNGKRSFNLQELACLAGFPASYRFFGGMGSIRKQVGNAVPACFAKVLFQEIIKTLKKSDQADAEWKPEIINIDD